MSVIRFAIVQDGVCVNTTVAEEEWGISMGWIPSDTAQIGDLYDGTTFTTPPPPPPEPWEMLQDLANEQGSRAHGRRVAFVNDYITNNGVPANRAAWQSTLAGMTEIPE